MKLRTIIADDEPFALELLKSYVEKVPFLELVGACKSAVEVMEKLEEEAEIDLLCLDIQMPSLTGMQLAKTLGADGPKIIFTTAFEEYAIEGYKVNAIDYLLKPFSFEEFLAAAQKAKRLSSNSETKLEDYIIVKSDYKLRQIELDDIIYIEGLKDYVKIYRESADKSLLTLMSMKKLEAKLPEDRFMRVHRSFIVNLNKIKVVERGSIVFGKEHIPVSDKYKEHFQEFLNQRFLD
jgi:DNA-binding LytR/AlgR family response regulator